MTERSLADLRAREDGVVDAPVELAMADVDQETGGLNPQPLPPVVERMEEIYLSDHWNR